VQLATIRADNPQQIVPRFRGFLEDTDQLKFVIDARSQKVDQIFTSPGQRLVGTFLKP